MKKLLYGILLSCVLAPWASADDASVLKAIDAYQDAFNRRDVSTIEAIWAPSAVLEDTTAETRLEGREAIVGQLKAVFAHENPPRLTIRTDSIEVQEDGSIVVSGMNTLETKQDEDAVSESFAFTAVIRSIENKWLITQVTETAAASQYYPSESIEWLIGVWTSDRGIVNEFRYVPGNRFIVRTFSTLTATDTDSIGYQMIGSLPGESSLRSWTFLGDGSVSRAEWFVEEDRILIQSTGRLADGSEASGTYVLKQSDENTLSIKLVGHTIDGEPVPSQGVVMLTRQNKTTETETSNPMTRQESGQ